MTDSTFDHGVKCSGLGKRFGDLWALRDLDLNVPPGSILGLLGHNGAGKTTAIRILTTLTRPTTGSATIGGIDVVEHPARVRACIGVAAQQATVDGLLSGRKNLEMVGRLYHLGRSESRRRAGELLERFDLEDAADRLVRTYSGGMRRRLDLAVSLIASPPVLFLDEPTTGLDPRARADLWRMLLDLARNGSTLILTTQYLDEADRLADQVVVLDHGRAVATGSPDDLKARIGGDRIDVTVAARSDLVATAAALAPFASGEPAVAEESSRVTAPIAEGSRLIDIVRALDASGVDALDINRRQATLDDVFLAITSPAPIEEERISA